MSFSILFKSSLLHVLKLQDAYSKTVLNLLWYVPVSFIFPRYSFFLLLVLLLIDLFASYKKQIMIIATIYFWFKGFIFSNTYGIAWQSSVFFFHLLGALSLLYVLSSIVISHYVVIRSASLVKALSFYFTLVVLPSIVIQTDSELSIFSKNVGRLGLSMILGVIALFHTEKRLSLSLISIYCLPFWSNKISIPMYKKELEDLQNINRVKVDGVLLSLAVLLMVMIRRFVIHLLRKAYGFDFEHIPSREMIRSMSQFEVFQFLIFNTIIFFYSITILFGVSISYARMLGLKLKMQSFDLLQSKSFNDFIRRFLFYYSNFNLEIIIGRIYFKLAKIKSFKIRAVLTLFLGVIVMGILFFVSIKPELISESLYVIIETLGITCFYYVLVAVLIISGIGKSHENWKLIVFKICAYILIMQIGAITRFGNVYYLILLKAISGYESFS